MSQTKVFVGDFIDPTKFPFSSHNSGISQVKLFDESLMAPTKCPLASHSSGMSQTALTTPGTGVAGLTRLMIC